MPVGGRRHAGNALDVPEGRCNLLRDGARRLAQAAGQLEGDRSAQIAEVAIRRILEHNRRRIGGRQREERGENVREVGAQAVVDGQDHLRYDFLVTSPLVFGRRVVEHEPAVAVRNGMAQAVSSDRIITSA